MQAGPAPGAGRPRRGVGFPVCPTLHKVTAPAWVLYFSAGRGVCSAQKPWGAHPSPHLGSTACVGGSLAGRPESPWAQGGRAPAEGLTPRHGWESKRRPQSGAGTARPSPPTEGALRPEAGREQKGLGHGTGHHQVRGPGPGGCGSHTGRRGDWEMTPRTPRKPRRAARCRRASAARARTQEAWRLGGSAVPPAASDHGVDATRNVHRGRGHTQNAPQARQHTPRASPKPPGGHPQHTASLGSHGGPPSAPLILNQDSPAPPPRDGGGESALEASPGFGPSTTETSVFPSKRRPRVRGLDRAGGSLLLNPLQPRPLTKGQRASASWAPRQPRGEEPPAKQETCSSPGLGRPHVRWSLWSTARGAATMRSHCSLQQRRPGQQQRPSTAKIKNAKHPRTEIRVAIKGKIQRFHLRGSPVLPHDGNARHPESLSLLDSAHFYLSREQQVTTPACTEESLARRPPGPEPSAHVGALKGGGPPGAQTPLRACSPMLTVLVRDDGAPGPAQAEGIPGAPKHPSSGGRSPVPPRAQRPSGHVTRAPRMQTRCPGPGRAGGQAPPCCPQAWRSGQAAPQVNVWQVNPTGRPGSRPTSNHRMAWKPWGGPPLPPAELAHLSVPPHTHSPPRLTGEGPSEAPSVPQLGLTPHADPPRGLHACHLPCSWLPLTSFDAPLMAPRDGN